jgi:hypothetical protein
MTAAALIPIPDPIPVAWGWFEGLNILTFAIHITLANILLGGGVIALYLKMRGESSPSANAVSERLPTIFALTVNFGVAPLLFLQVLYGQFFYTSAVLSASWWMTITALLILGYYAFYIYQHKQDDPDQKGLVYLRVGTILTFVVALILTSVLTTMARPETWTEYFNNPNGTILNLLEPTFIPRFLHYLSASVALGGLFMALLAHFGRAPSEGGKIGMSAFTFGTMLQIPTGMWWLYALDHSVLSSIGDSFMATTLLVVAIALTIPTLAAGFGKKPLAAAGWAFATILAMCGVRAVVRHANLNPHFAPGDMIVTGEYSPMAMFLIVLVIGVAALGYMLRLGFKEEKEG